MGGDGKTPSPQEKKRSRLARWWGRRKALKAASSSASRRLGVPLRITLVLILMLVSAGGLTVSSAAIGGTLKSYAYSHVDQLLYDALDGWAGRNLPRLDPETPRPPTDFFVMKIYPYGGRFIVNDKKVEPDLHGVILNSSPVTVPTYDHKPGDPQWRVIAVSSDNITTIVAHTLSSEDAMIGWLFVMEFLIGAVVLIMIGIIGWLSIRRALRPLREVEETAVAIAAGDLSRRVPDSPSNTEVGQLSESLNVMIGRLQHSIDDARDKEEQMRRFVGDASHELRTPLTSVQGYAELYRSGATTDANFVIKKIEQEARRMSLLVEDLLALTRAEKIPLNMGTVDVLELAMNVVGSMKAAHPGRDIRVATQGDIPLVAGDASRLHQVLVNLINNALIHGGDKATVTVTVGTNPTTHSGFLDVTDDGVGMDEDTLQHIFERFFRADKSRSRSQSTGGSGLGLAIVKSLVGAHHGTITVTSTPGRGTSFTVTLPTSKKSTG